MSKCPGLALILWYDLSNEDEIKSRLKSGNVCYHSVQSVLSSSLLSKNIKINPYRTNVENRVSL